MAEPTTRKRGRPSLAKQRRGQIVSAFIELIGQRGLERVSLDDVAAAAGVKRAAVHHFVGNREQLVVAALEEICRRYIDDLHSAAGAAPQATELIEAVFRPGWENDHSPLDAAFKAMLAESQYDPDARALIKSAYDVMIDETVLALRRSYPEAPLTDVRDAAYVIVCLIEQNNEFQQLGYPAVRSTAARNAALAAADRLRTRR